MKDLKLNPQKAQCIFIGSHQDIAKIPIDTVIVFRGCYIRPNTTVNKSVGIHRDTWYWRHINHIYRKVIGAPIYTNHIKYKIPTETRVPVIQTLALTSINYCQNI